MVKSVLRNHKLFAIDTQVFIYYLESNPEFFGRAKAVFELLRESSPTAVTSVITITELIAKPGMHDLPQLSEHTARIIHAIPHLELVDVSLAIATRATSLRSRHRLRTQTPIRLRRHSKPVRQRW